MPQAAAPLSSHSPQWPAAAPPTPASAAGSASAPPGPQLAQLAPAAPASPIPASSPTPFQLFREVVRLAYAFMTRLIAVLQPVQFHYLEQSRQAMQVCVALCRVMLTVRFAPERITHTQLRHLARVRHIIQALFNYTLPQNLGTPISRLASGTPVHQSPSASANSATPLGARTPSSASSPTSNNEPLPPDPSHTSHHSHAPQSSFAPYIPDAGTLIDAIRAATLPANCAGALFDDPGEALVKALRQLHAVYFSLYPNQSPSPSPVQSPSQSQSQSSANLQSTISNLQSSNPQSAAPSVHPVNDVNKVNDVRSVHNVQSVQSVHSPASAQSEIPIPQSSIPHSKGEDPVGLRDRIPHSTAPP